jgi:hypothetical protein
MSRPRGCVITHLRDITSSGNSTGGSAGSPFVQKSISVLDSCSWASLSADANALSNITTHHHSVTQTHPIQQTNPWRLEESHSILQSVVSRYFTPPVRSSPVQSGPVQPSPATICSPEGRGSKQEPLLAHNVLQGVHDEGLDCPPNQPVTIYRRAPSTEYRVLSGPGKRTAPQPRRGCRLLNAFVLFLLV